MKNKKKMKSWFTVGLLFLGIGLISWLFLPSSSIKANPATNELGATAKELILSQNEEFPELTTKSGLEKLFEKESLPANTKDFSYEYSNEKGKIKKPSSVKVGYRQIYVKMTNKRTKKSNVISVPVTITNGGTTLLAENQAALQLDSEEEYIQFQAKEVENKTAEELQQLVTEKANARAWRTDTGKELPVTVSKTTIDPAVAGNYNATFDIAVDEQKQAVQVEKEVLVQENTRMLNPSPKAEEATTDWELLPQGQHTQFVNQNFNDPDTPSGILLNNGIPGNIYSYMRDKRELYRFPLKFGYSLKAGVGSLFGNTVGMPTIVPFQNGTPLTSVAEQDRVGKVYVKKSISNPKEIVRVKTEASDKYLNPDIKFIYEMWIAPNQSFRVRMSIQNIGNSTMNLGFVNKGEVSSGGMTNVQPFQIRSLGNGRGVHGLFGKDAAGGQSEFSIDFKPRVDDPYAYWEIRPDKKQGDADRDEEWKALTYSGLKPGMENNKVKPGEVLFPDNLLSYIYTAGVPERPVAAGESVSATWDIYFGVALPYISIEAEPEEYNVYQDTKKQEFNYNYTLGKMPLDSSYGTLTVTYPDKSEEKKPFSAVNNTGSVTVPRTKLPEQLNNNPGTIETYTTSLFGINEDPAGQPGLPTEDKYLNVNVYNLGATPIPQVVAKDSTWNKTAESLIKDPVYLPGNTVTTNYVKTKPIDTSKVGLQHAEVIMTDKTEQPNKTAIIKVPVMVIDGEIPKDFVFGVKDFSVDKSEIANLTDDQLKKLIIEKSNATAWDVITGLSDDIKFSVVKKTLETTSEASKTPYTARISAEKDGVQKEETVNITVTAKSKLTVQFVDEDNLPIETPVTLEKNVGDTVNLREEEGIKQLLEKQKERGYVELAKPEKDTSYPIANKDETVTYQFKTKSKLTVEFVNEKDTVLNSVELNKKIGSKVDLTVEDSIQKLVSKYKAMNYTLLESPTPEDAYPNTLDDKQTVRYKYQTSSKLTVQFVDENSKILDSKDTVELQKEIGVPVDLTQEKTVQDIVNKYKGMNYKVLESPTPENTYPITADDQTITYKFQTTSKLVVNFIDEDNKEIESPITLTKKIGSTVNLREDAEIKALLNKQKGLGYEEIATPKNDTNYPIANKDESVTYQFKTKSKLTVEFVNEKNAVLNTVELTKQIGSKVDLTKETDVLAVLDPLKAKYPLLSSPAKETDYEMANNDAQKVTYQFKTEAKLTVQFVDENNKILDSKDTVELQKEIGVPVDLTQEKTIQDIVNKYKGMNYVLLESPTPENAYPIMADDQTITYKFQTNSKLIINFVNEKNEQLKTLELDKEVGKPVNLSKEQSIVDTLAELDKENHVLEKRPDNEANYPVGATNAPVTYYFRSYATLVVEFLNASISNEDVLREPLRLEKRIGTVFDFIEDSEITTIIDGFMDKGYGIAGYRPESPYTITRDAEQQIEFQIALDGEIPVEFVDEKNTIIKKFEMVRDIGKLDLSEDRDILDAIKELQTQNYEVIERPVNEKTYQVKMDNDKVVYKVKKTEVALKIRFVDEEGKDIPSVESINSTVIIGSTLDLTQYETEIKKRLTKLEEERYELVESPTDKQEIKGPLELFYRFKGSLFISSYPETLDFGSKYLSKIVKGEQPKYDKDLIVKDTRKNNKSPWKLSATLEKPLTSKENPSEVINNVFFYKQNATTKVPLLTGQAQPIETGAATTVGEEYNISKKWTDNKTGLELIVHSNKVYQTGKYTASVLWQVEATP